MERRRARQPLIEVRFRAGGTQRSVRFSDSEWELVKKGAIRERISAAEFVRNVALGASVVPAPKDYAALPPGVIEILKHTYRAA